jgi:hypothetical protein
MKADPHPWARDLSQLYAEVGVGRPHHVEQPHLTGPILWLVHIWPLIHL